MEGKNFRLWPQGCPWQVGHSRDNTIKGEKSMKKVSILLVLALLLTGGALAIMSVPSQAQFYGTPPAPAPMAPSMAPYVGQNTPWTYYNGDWFLNGILYYFFGQKYGWAPYYAYPPVYIVRPGNWYGPKWQRWYRTHPVYYQRFQRAYPYWHNHHEGQRYDENFYNRYHRGQGGGWQKSYHGEGRQKGHHDDH
jgi:hypothetical protein